MKNQKEIRDFIKNIRLLLRVNQDIPHSPYYIIYSPFVYNKMEWCKELKGILLELLKKELWLDSKEYMKYMWLSMRKFHPDIQYFISMHTVIPEYRTHFIYWLNVMYFSSINMQFLHNWWLMHAMFTDHFEHIHINHLWIKDIVIPLYLMHKEAVSQLALSNRMGIDSIRTNNILLMLVSDYRDILQNIRKKEYEYDLKKVDERMGEIEIKTWVNRDLLFWLDFGSLISINEYETNYKR